MIKIIQGITEVNPEQHVAVAHYRAHADEGEDRVQVVEMANGPALHLGNREFVFGRWITRQEHEDRMAARQQDPEQFYKDHLKSLSH